jgi:hypothetical protein
MKTIATLFFLLPLLALAELAPSVYEAMQARAPEYLKIEVLRVDVSPGETPSDQKVHVVAMVTQTIRTATELSPDAIINIVYTVTDRPEGWVGPGAVPILEERQQTVAYLAKGESTDYAPAAGRMSFNNF